MRAQHGVTAGSGSRCLLSSSVRRCQPKRGSRWVVRAGIQPGADLVSSGKVRMVNPADLKQVLDEGYQILDIRPPYEVAKARVKGSMQVPYFVEDDGQDPYTWIRRVTHAGYGGIWNGAPLTTINEDFVKEVEEEMQGGKEKPTIVACAQGLRSLVAIKELDDAGFTNLAWLYGGLIMADGSVETEGEESLRMSNIGGVSKVVFELFEKIEGMASE